MLNLADRLRRDETVMMAWSSIASMGAVDLLARTDFSAVTLDMQHGAHHEQSVHDGIGAIIGAGSSSLVRIPVARNDMASRALDFGAEAIIAPMINTKDEAQALVRATKYPPLGERSWGPFRAIALHGFDDPKAYMRSANDKTLAFAMVETRMALQALDDILSVEGIDGIFIGPTDFSISWTGGADVDAHLPDMLDAMADIAARTRAAGKIAGLFVFDPDRAQDYVAMGFRLLAITHDAAFLNAGAKAASKAARGVQD